MQRSAIGRTVQKKGPAVGATSSPLPSLSEERAVVWEADILPAHLILFLALNPDLEGLYDVVRLVVVRPLGGAVSVNLIEDFFGGPDGDAVFFVVDDFVFFHLVLGGFVSQCGIDPSDFKQILKLF
jgi:hypothetical protein